MVTLIWSEIFTSKKKKSRYDILNFIASAAYFCLNSHHHRWEEVLDPECRQEGSKNQTDLLTKTKKNTDLAPKKLQETLEVQGKTKRHKVDWNPGLD